MLKQIKIENLVLCSYAEWDVGPGFTVITGETGSGKSAFIEALSLIAGKKGESSLVKEGSSSFKVTASVFLTSSLRDFFNLKGVEPPSLVEVVREGFRSGRNRIFIGGVSASLQELKQALDSLFVFLNHTMARSLLERKQQEALFFEYADIVEKKKQLEILLKKREEEKKRVLFLEEQLPLKEKKLKRCEEELLLLHQVEKDFSQENELFLLYSSLTEHEKERDNAELFLSIFEMEGFLPLFQRLLKTTENAFSDKPFFKDVKEAFHLMEGASFDVRKIYEKLSDAKNHALALKGRLEAVDRVKKYYQLDSFEEFPSFLERKEKEFILWKKIEERLAQKIKEVESLEIEIKDLQDMVRENLDKKHGHFIAQTLSWLKTFGMGEAVLEVELFWERELPAVLFSFAAQPKSFNKSHIKASGGELGRFVLAVYLALSEGREAPFFVFDEVDANIGGVMAKEVGKALKVLGKSGPVVAVSHFPQLASEADHHLLVKKYICTQKGAHSALMQLSLEEKTEELARMAGYIFI